VWKRILKMLLMIIIMCIIIIFLILSIPRIITGIYSHDRIYSIETAPVEKIAIVFGAGLWKNGTATPILYDRVETAVQLYKSGKVGKILMSGDNRFVDYNEPAVMREVAISLGVPDDEIILDYAGRSTYDTCYRAKEIFGVEKAILVTQAFHLPRAIYTCNHLGVDSIGVEADRRVYRKSSRLFWNTRELLATVNALWEIHVTHPLPVLGNPEPIFP
jgi:SanA protein